MEFGVVCQQRVGYYLQGCGGAAGAKGLLEVESYRRVKSWVKGRSARGGHSQEEEGEEGK